MPLSWVSFSCRAAISALVCEHSVSRPADLQGLAISSLPVKKFHFTDFLCTEGRRWSKRSHPEEARRAGGISVHNPSTFGAGRGKRFGNRQFSQQIGRYQSTFCLFVVQRTKTDEVIIVQPFVVVLRKRRNVMHLNIMRIYALCKANTAQMTVSCSNIRTLFLPRRCAAELVRL